MDTEMLTEETPADIAERQAINKFKFETCGCKMGVNNDACSSNFEEVILYELRQESQELTKEELDLVIMSAIRSSCSKNGERKIKDGTFSVHGHHVCLKTFLFVHSIGNTRFYNIFKHFMENGLTNRKHGNTARRPVNAFPHQVVERVKTFLENYSLDHAVKLPGRSPGCRDLDAELLPSSTTKAHVWEVYRQSSIQGSREFVGLSTFKQLWSSLMPNLIVMKPMTDLCWVCQQNHNKILESSNEDLHTKLEMMLVHENHLLAAQKERHFYNQCVEECKIQIQRVTNRHVIRPQSPLCSFDGLMHYSFDYAQQLHYLSNPLQPGPIYFNTTRKCQLFGVCCEAATKQINYLVDEEDFVGKGANATISLLHSFFENHGYGETDALLHADNCTGQNKNNIFVQYLLWRTMTNRHKRISYDFMIAGHTKFLPDAYFGMMKKKTRREYSRWLEATCVDGWTPGRKRHLETDDDDDDSQQDIEFEDNTIAGTKSQSETEISGGVADKEGANNLSELLNNLQEQRNNLKSTSKGSACKCQDIQIEVTNLTLKINNLEQMLRTISSQSEVVTTMIYNLSSFIAASPSSTSCPSTSQPQASHDSQPQQVPLSPYLEDSFNENVNYELDQIESQLSQGTSSREIDSQNSIEDKNENRDLYVLDLLDKYFTEQEMATSNVNGTNGKTPLNHKKVAEIRQRTFKNWPAAPAEGDCNMIWRSLTTKINTKCRGKKKKLKRTLKV